MNFFFLLLLMRTEHQKDTCASLQYIASEQHYYMYADIALKTKGIPQIWCIIYQVQCFLYRSFYCILYSRRSSSQCYVVVNIVMFYFKISDIATQLDECSFKMCCDLMFCVVVFTCERANVRTVFTGNAQILHVTCRWMKVDRDMFRRNLNQNVFIQFVK